MFKNYFQSPSYFFSMREQYLFCTLSKPITATIVTDSIFTREFYSCQLPFTRAKEKTAVWIIFSLRRLGFCWKPVSCDLTFSVFSSKTAEKLKIIYFSANLALARTFLVLSDCKVTFKHTFQISRKTIEFSLAARSKAWLEMNVSGEDLFRIRLSLSRGFVRQLTLGLCFFSFKCFRWSFFSRNAALIEYIKSEALCLVADSRESRALHPSERQPEWTTPHHRLHAFLLSPE